VLLYRGAPTAFDEWLALPLALETARPGTYPAGDLLVHGSLQGPFHLYKAASVLWTLGIDVDIAWYVLLVLSLVVFFLAVWRLGRAMSLDARERTLLVFAIAATPIYRGTLNWCAEPNLSFITASVAVPLALLAVAAAIEQRGRRALVFAAVTFGLHPALGLCPGLTALSLVPWPRTAKALWREWMPAALITVPNLVYLVLHRPAPGIGTDDRLWEIAETFAYHTFVRDHWRDGYPWFALLFALALIGAAQLSTEGARRARHAALVLAGLAVGWIVVMNVMPIPALLPLYLIRASWLVKPLILGLALTLVTRHRFAGRYAFLAPWAGAVAIAHPDRMIAEVGAAIVLGIVLRPSSDWRLKLIGTAAWTCAIVALLSVLARRAPALDVLMDPVTPLRLLLLAVGLMAVAALVVIPVTTASTPWTPSRRLLLAGAIALPLLSVMLDKPFGRGWLPESAAVLSGRLHLSRPRPAEEGAMNWARLHSPPGSLFAVPPVDHYWVRFRLAAERGVYATVHDVNQLMYVRNAVLPTVERLQTLGVLTRGPHRFDPRPYLRPTCRRLQRLAQDSVAFYVLPAGAAALTGGVVAFSDSSYAVLDVRQTAARCTFPAL
jgi:hypothetical protein